jgi:hypothetical protein
MGGPVRHRPKSALLASLWAEHRAAILYDLKSRLNIEWHPLDWTTWAKDQQARSNIGYWAMWQYAAEILRDKSSHSYAALAGWSYVPSPTERAIWTLMPKREGKEDYLPWTDPKQDILRPVPTPAIHDAAWKKRRRHFKEIWGEQITPDEQ